MFDIVFFCILFGIFEKLLFLIAAGYYSVYFFLYDHVGFLFSEKERERFLLDFYEKEMALLNSLKLLENDIKKALTGDIVSILGKNLENTILQIQKLLEHIKYGKKFLKDKTKFQQFLI